MVNGGVKLETQAVKQPSKWYSYLMMLGHMCADMNQSAIPALLPFLVLYRGFDYASAAGLMFAGSFMSSLIQPLLGTLADRKQMPQLMAIGILMTGVGISAIGFLEYYWAIFAAVMFVGLGNAIFHPEGGRMANCVAGKEKGKSMSNFVVGGNLGFAIGPIITVLAVSQFGMQGTAVLMIPTLAMVAVLVSLQSKFVQMSKTALREARKVLDVTGQKDDWFAMFKLCISIFARSVVQGGLTTFIPLYWVGILMQTQQQGGLMVTVMALSAAASAFIGGRIADRIGFSRVIRMAFMLPFPLIIMITLTNSAWVATALIVPLVLVLNLGQGPSVALGQKYLPSRLGTATGITLGLSVSVGGIAAPLLGMVGDSFGLPVVLYVLSGVAFVGLLGALLVKDPVVPKLAPAEVTSTAGQ